MLQVVAEVIRLLLQAIGLAGEQAPEVQQDLMAVLLLIMIQDMVPRMSSAPALRDLAVKLLTQIASGTTSASFKAVAANLDPQHKLKLQVLCTFVMHVSILAKMLSTSLVYAGGNAKCDTASLDFKAECAAAQGQGSCNHLEELCFTKRYPQLASQPDYWSIHVLEFCLVPLL